jgi:hypothetical protein
MNIVINTEKCKSENITIFKNSKHKTRIGYKEDKLHLNGLCLNLNLKGLCILYIDRCYKCTFAYQKNKDVLEKLIQIEKEILSKYVCPISTKRPVYHLARQLVETPGTISLLHIKRGLYKSVVVKLIGIWENETEYGLIYFFYPTNLEPYATTTITTPATTLTTTHPTPQAVLFPEWVHPYRSFRYPTSCINS